ncbi:MULTISPECIES: restriction endonuclease subunit S [Halomonadaceae]|jgi:type I restriction enzyme S subunit|uniref:restriction endonuclease subunit S n=1 Tax=Halomonadaceae TaxID=28256 RepID=UPI0018EFE4EA|nr:restriction endonuclease subunit S [Halomonas sp. A40-4]QPL45921.1 restriction endonuclease subunit S [Halomonas sp. A40-4]
MSDHALPGWSRVNLTDLAAYINGYAFKPEDWSEHGLPIVRIAQITGSSADCDYYQGRLSEDFKIDNGDIIFSWSGTLCVVQWNGGPAWLNQHLFKVKPSEGVSHRLLYHVLSHAVAEMDKSAHGSTMKHIKRSELKRYELLFPNSRKEQEKIGRVLNTLDTQIQKTEALIAKLEKVKEGLLHDLLTRGIDESGRLRPSPEQAPELYKESPLGLIPREWEVVGFLDAVELPSGQISPLIEPYASLPLIAPDHIEAGVSRLIRVETARDQGAISGKYIVRPGDVVYSKIRPYLRKAWLADIDSICSADMYPLRPKLLTSAILLRIVMSESFSTYANAASMRTGIPKINRDELSGYTFALPTIQEQVRMENIFQGIERKADKEREALSKLVFEKIGLMDDLLTGRVRVTPLLDQAQATTPA